MIEAICFIKILTVTSKLSNSLSLVYCAHMHITFNYFLFILQVIFFLGGWIFFVKKLFRDYEVHHRLVQLIFSTTFSLSCTMFELIIFEIIRVLDSR